MRRLWRSCDLWLAAGLFALGAIAGSIDVRGFEASGRRTSVDFGQYEFGAAVAMACGHGYADPAAAPPALTAFLELKVDRFSCAELPPAMPLRTPNFTQRLYRYLLSTVALVWMIRGVSWWALWPLFGVAYGATIAIVYGLFRLAVGRIAALLGALAVTISVVHLTLLPFLRDYAKAPFILGLLLLMALVGRHAARPRLMFTFAALFGIVCGVGFGFRNDILIVVPPFAVATLFWELPRDRYDVARRFAAMALAAGLFVIVAWPIVSAYRGGSNSGHVALLGLLTPFDAPLGVSGSVYQWGYAYLDRFVDTVIQSHSLRVDGRTVGYLSADYDRDAIAYIVQIARHWPADILVRAYGAVLKVVEFPFRIGTYAERLPVGVTGSFLLGLYDVQQRVLRVFQGTGVGLVIAALVMVSARSVLQACLMLIALLYFAGYPAIQFQPRHFFHLEFVAWLALLFVAERALSIAIGAARAPGRAASFIGDSRTAAKRAGVFATIAAVSLLLPMLAARAYQQRHVLAMLTTYAEAKQEVVVADARPAARGRTLLETRALWDRHDPAGSVDTRYVVAEFSPACGMVSLPVTFRYAAPDASHDYSLDTVVALAGGDAPTHIFFPAYQTADGSRFIGIEVPAGSEMCLSRLTQVSDLRPFPMLLNLTFPSQWKESRLYQTLTAWDAQPEASRPEQHVETLPRSLGVSRSLLDAPLDSLPPATLRTPIVRNEAEGRWSIRGIPPGPQASLVQFGSTRHTPDDRFVVEGYVRRGGIAVGLLQGESWAGDTNLTIARRGAFAAVLAPASTGLYGILFVNSGDDSWLLRNVPYRLLKAAWFFTPSDISIKKAGWVSGKGSHFG